MYSVFRDRHGVILVDFLKTGTSIHCEQCVDTCKVQAYVHRIFLNAHSEDIHRHNTTRVHTSCQQEELVDCVRRYCKIDLTFRL
jgi:Na+-translocating ferredoxin:NAD+ oxidoreductase RnfC subunit